MIRKLLYFLTFLIIIVLSTVYFGLFKLSIYTNQPISYFPNLIFQALKQPSLTPGFNFILLGVDPRDDQLEKTQVSDTIIIGRLTSQLRVNLISIPRDLWIYSQNKKINQIYPAPLSEIQTNFSQITGQNIDRTIILTTSNLIDLTSLIGGVDINLPSNYTDHLYPNPEYIKNPRPGVPMYITVNFKSGLNHLDSSNITQFVRSRKGQYADGTGSSDIGRIARQQLLIDGVLAKIKSPQFISQPQNLINLYKFWKTDIQSNLSDGDLISLAIKIQKNYQNINIFKSSIPVSEYPQKNIIYHPAKFTNQQWVFIPLETDYSSFQRYISDFLSS